MITINIEDRKQLSLLLTTIHKHCNVLNQSLMLADDPHVIVYLSTQLFATQNLYSHLLTQLNRMNNESN